ncbi:MAG: hypothetical protein BRC29_00010 [Nanohaloarchaea archaeon SW_7_43_1]|nr:MAG: hypothetical protein BRC29_00010 [Nanohaloarchaea archaeon SW_7_43_1]
MPETNSLEEAEIIIQKIPSDIGIHRNPRKGALNAPEILVENTEFSQEILIDEIFPDEFDLEETQKRIKDDTKDLLQYQKPILSIGGDHSVSFPVIKTLKEKHPDLKLVWLDSHLDLKKKVDDHVSHDVVVRELLKWGFTENEIWFVGVTEVDHDEEEFTRDSGFHIYQADEVEKFVREFRKDGSPVYLSVDIDVLKEEIAPGTGYPDGELTVENAEKVIEAVKPDSADLVEVAPPFDEDGKTVSNAGRILEKLQRCF